MKHYDDISLLVDRFLDGVTSLSEERRLDEFFMSHESEVGEMSEHLQIAAEMFRELRAMSCETTVGNGSVSICKNKSVVSHWMKWAVAIVAACLVLCFILFSPNGKSFRLEENSLQVAESTVDTQPDTISAHKTECRQPGNPIAEASKNKPVNRQTKTVDPKYEQETMTSSSDAREIHYDQTGQTSNVMLCGFNPGANMLPMHTDVTTRAVISECEMTILEEDFQKSERNRQTIEI